MIEAADLTLPIESDQIRLILPHRYPMLLVDRVIAVDWGKWIEALKCVTQNEPWADGHFPGRPIMPGVLLAESMAQAGAIMLHKDPRVEGKVPILGALQKVRFRRLVRPGDVLSMRVELERFRLGVGRAKARATVDGELAVEGVVDFTFIPR